MDVFRETVDDPVTVAKRVSDRRFGIGSDGLILIQLSETADFRMEMYNADGSRRRRCATMASAAWRSTSTTTASRRRPRWSATTDASQKILDLTLGDDGKVTQLRVHMGVPIL